MSAVCIASHDAGGAEILASYAVQNNLRCRLVLEGPAVAVFERHMGQSELLPLQEAIAGSEWCLLGTSWQSDLEWRAIGEARRAGKRVVSFLDHWINYPERFVRNGTRNLPDEIWVGDEDAQALARTHFPGLPLRLVPNPYFIHAEREIARYGVRQAAQAASVLFICENISEHASARFGDERHWGYTEFDAIDYFLNNIDRVGPPIGRLLFRPHPSDRPGKYAALISAHAPLADLSRGKPLLQEIAEADIVVGCESTALVLALRAGKRVLCSVPPGGKVHHIDQRRGIEMLRDLVPVSQP